MSDEDLASIIVYLRSSPPVRNPLPDSAVPFPVKSPDQRRAGAGQTPVAADLSTPEKRGRYDVDVLAVCADCHTPMDAQGNRVPGMDLRRRHGAAIRRPQGRHLGQHHARPSTGFPTTPRICSSRRCAPARCESRQLDDMMPTQYYRNMTDQDLKDIFAYLKTLQAVDHYVDNSLPPTKCAKCGLTHGGGDRNKKIL